MASFYIRLFYTLVCCLAALTASSQQFHYQHFTTKEGLAGDNVYYIIEDKQGFIWIGTETGLSRFDGTSFKNFSVKDGLPSNEVIGMMCDRRNRIWISTFSKEIALYEKGKICNKKNSDLIRKIEVTSETKTIAEDRQGRILVCTERMAVIISPDQTIKTGKFIPLNDRSGFTYIGTELFDPYKMTYHIPGAVLPYHARIHDRHNTTYPDASNDFNAEADTNRSLMRFQTRGLHDQTFCSFYNDSLVASIKFPKGSSILICRDTALFMNTPDGTLHYDTRTGRLKDHFLPGYRVNMCFQDKNGGYWIGTHGSGLYYLPSTNIHQLRPPTWNTPMDVSNILSNDGKLYITVNDTRELSISEDRYYKEVTLPGKGDQMWQHFSPPPHNIIKKPGRLLDDLISHFSELRSIQIKSVASDSGRYLVATGSYAASDASKTTGRVIWLGRTTCALSVGDKIYIGTLSGLFMIPKNSPQVFTDSTAKKIMDGTMNTLSYVPATKTLWVGTTDRGLIALQNDKPVHVFDESSGLPGNICQALITDSSRIFVGSPKGLTIIYPLEQFRMEHLFAIDGLPSDNITCFHLNGSKLYVGTTDGLALLKLTKPFSRVKPEVYITDVTVSGVTYSDTNNLALAPRDNNIAFNFSGIAFHSIGKILYHYRLIGLTDNWQTTTEQQLQWPSLPPGDYTFEIYMTDRDGKSSETKSLIFTVKEKWWQHAWLQLIAAIFLASLVFMFLRWRAKNIQKREQEQLALKSKIVELEQLALRAQMNPHFIFNSLNSFYQYVINKDLAGASKFINDFSRLIRLLFETTSLTEITLDKEISFLSIYLELEKTKMNNSFQYSIDIAPDIPQEEVAIPSFIIQPFVENSIRHGIQNRGDSDGIISVTFRTPSPTLLTVTVDDNGVGRTYTEKMRERLIYVHRSSGIELTEQRIELYNKTHNTDVRFEFIDKMEGDKPAGTTVIFYFSLTEEL